MNILLGKIGQKVIFNRSSKDCDRSNTNGNVGTYLLFKLLIENNKDDMFYFASDNDLSTFDVSPYRNLVDVSKYSWEDVNKLNIDVMFVLTGLMSYEKGNRFLNVINNLSAKLILLSDDPRCLDSVSDDDRMTKYPSLIISQFSGIYKFKEYYYNVNYVPLERASCYKCKIHKSKKDIDMIVISNTSGKEYNRAKIISDIIDDTSGINIYGRLSDEERKLLGEDNCKGEIKYADMQNTLRKSSSTFMVPIKKGWVTSKYVESLMNWVLPIFHEDYNTSLLEANSKGLKELIVVSNKEELSNVLENLVKKNKRKVNRLIRNYIKVLIKPYADGKILSDTLISYAMITLMNAGGIEDEYC